MSLSSYFVLYYFIYLFIYYSSYSVQCDIVLVRSDLQRMELTDPDAFCEEINPKSSREEWKTETSDTVFVILFFVQH